MKNLQSKILKFKEAINAAKENPLIVHLEDYEGMIAGNIEKGNIIKAKCHAELLISYYVGDNPYTPDQEERIEAIKEIEELKPLYQIMDGARKMYRVGKATEELLKNLK